MAERQLVHDADELLRDHEDLWPAMVGGRCSAGRHHLITNG